MNGLQAGLVAMVMPIALNSQSFAEWKGMMGAFQESRVLLTAVELDVFTAVGGGAAATRVAERCGTGRRGLEMLLNALVAFGALSKSGETYRNTEATARHLVRGSTEDMRAALMHTVNQWRAWNTLTESVRKGTAVLPLGVEGAQDREWTEAFIAAMHAGARGTAERVAGVVGLAGVRRMLDVGGGLRRNHPRRQRPDHGRPAVRQAG